MTHPIDTGPGSGAGVEWAEREALLQRIGVELSLITQGGDAKLDDILNQLRAGLREGRDTPALASMADGLFQYLALADSGAGKQAVLPVATAVQDLLQALQVPMANFSQAQQLTEDAGRASSDEEIIQVLNRGVALLKEINQFVDQPAPVVERAEPVAANTAPKESSWFKKIKRLGREEITASQIFEALRPLLDRVLDKVASLDDASRQVVVIKAQLPTIQHPRDMQKVLEQVLDLLANIAAGISSERKNTEKFLGELREKLHGIEQGIVGTADTASMSRVESLNSTLGKEVTGIQQAVDQETTMEGLRQLIDRRVEKIGGTLQAYLDEERVRHQDKEQQVKDLTRKVREMEVESQQLRAKVQEKQQAATRDMLTGVFNRLGYEEQVVDEFARANRIGCPLAMLVVDVDGFKAVNDTYGHKAGDLVLQKVVEVLKRTVRKTDSIARYGGDEFVLLLPDTQADGALKVAEKLRAGVERCGFHNNGAPVNVTICCGVTQVRDDDTPELAFERADAAMYQVKKGDRNGCALSK